MLSSDAFLSVKTKFVKQNATFCCLRSFWPIICVRSAGYNISIYTDVQNKKPTILNKLEIKIQSNQQ